MVVVDDLKHDFCCFEGGTYGDFACGGFDEVGACLNGYGGGLADELWGEFACLKYYFEGAGGGFLSDGGNLVEDLLTAAFDEGSAGDDHVDLVGAFLHCIADFLELDGKWGLS